MALNCFNSFPHNSIITSIQLWRIGYIVVAFCFGYQKFSPGLPAPRHKVLFRRRRMVGTNYSVTPVPVESTEGHVHVAPKTTTNCFLRLIQRHYSVSPKVKSDEETDREKWLIPKFLLFNRWFLLPAAVLIQFSCGSLYAWSVFNKPIDQLMGTTNVAPIIFCVAVGCFGIAAGLGGPYVQRKGPRFIGLSGITLIFIGYLVTALGLQLRLMSLAFIGYGGFVGAGFGICYISPVSTVQKWFPDKRGFGGGIATCGFGAGSIVMAKLEIPLIDGVGLPLTFVILDAIFLILMIPSVLVLRTPPNNFNPKDTQSSTKIVPLTEKPPEMDITSTATRNLDDKGDEDVSLRSRIIVTEESRSQNAVVVSDVVVVTDSPVAKNISSPVDMSLLDAITSMDFGLMVVMFVGDITFGIVIMAARLANIIIDIFGKSPTEAATVVSICGGVNFVGRLCFSIASDYIGRKYCYVLMLVTQVLVLGFFTTMTNGQLFVPFWIAISFATTTYGAAFGVIPAYITDKFGPTNVAACHGLIIAAWAGTGVIGGLIFTVVFDSLVRSGHRATDPMSYNVNAWWIFGVACIGLIAVFFIKPSAQDLKCKKNILKQVYRVLRID